ncbi:MAG: bifunctional shikimate kinase/3-dehydroquinate synthase [Myxococcales bacterium]|nr:bifunctional shikimate kinase/3-dehydroquinate synthase [Myxococcales bacterium]
MAAGKSTVGPLAAAALGRRFLDLDDEIAARHGVVVAELVGKDEAAFRHLEAATLRALIAEAASAAASAPGAVIATGGGAACFADNMAVMRAAGLVVNLAVDVATAATRAAGSGQARPMLGDHAHASALHRARDHHYREAHASIATDELAPTEVARRLVEIAQQAEALGDLATTAFVATATTYPVVVGSQAWPLLAEAVRQAAGASGVYVGIDANVAMLHRVAIESHLRRQDGGAARMHEMLAGEASKSLAAYEQVTAAFLQGGVDRHAHLIAVGGGAASDALGFAAATIMRGVAWSVVPTTLLAMVDAAIGGKTALDTARGKNTLGAFWQPRGVWAGLDVLGTLPARERRSAFGELIKYALLDGESMWQLVDAHAAWAKVGGPVPTTLAEVIYRAARFKCHIVSVDERETKQTRVLLNLGHPLGHAIEHATPAMPHGEAVGLGLLAAARVSEALGLAPAELAPRIKGLLAACGLSHELTPHLTSQVLGYISSDKKRRGATLEFVAMRDVGDCTAVNLTISDFDRILRGLTN